MDYFEMSIEQLKAWRRHYLNEIADIDGEIEEKEELNNE